MSSVVFMIYYYLFFIGFFVGIIGGEFNVLVWGIVLGAGVFVWNWRMGLVFLMALILGCGRIFLLGFESGSLSEFNEIGEVVVSGKVIDVDERREYSVLVVEAEEVMSAGIDWQKVTGRLRVKRDRFPRFEYGDLVEVKGQLETPENFEDFNYAGYLARYGIYSVVSFADVRKIGEGDGDLFWGSLVSMRKFFEGRLNVLLHEPYSSFMAGLLMGSRKGIPQEVLDDFQVTGLTHIIAISGYNITILIIFVSGVLGFLERRVQVWFSVGLIVAFTILVGASAAVVRAAIMGVLGLMAKFVGRKQFVGLAIGWSAFLMVAWNPYILVYDIGFQLSFLAVLSLVYVMPHIEKWFVWLPEWGGVREAMASTIAAQVLVLPVIIFYFGQVSLVSPFANVLVLPFLPMAMSAGALMLLMDLILGWSMVFEVVVVFVLKLVLVLVKICAGDSYAAIEVVDVPIWIFVAYYFVVLWFIRSRKDELLDA